MLVEHKTLKICIVGIISYRWMGRVAPKGSRDLPGVPQQPWARVRLLLWFPALSSVRKPMAGFLG